MSDTATSHTVTVSIPTALRPQVDNQDSIAVDVAADGSTVNQVLASLTTQYPELGKRLFKGENVINRFINVYVNDEDIRFLDNLESPLKPGDELSIVPAIAGG